MVNPTLYLLFLGIAVPTVLTPGPGVLMSLTNSIRLGVPRATPGIIGVALGTLMIAALSATGLGVILAASPTAYNVIKLAGMVFMLYLGWKRFNANPNFLRVVNYTGRKEQGAPEAGFSEKVLSCSSPTRSSSFFICRFFRSALTPTSPTGRSSCFCRFPTHCLSGSFIPVTAGWGTKPQSAL